MLHHIQSRASKIFSRLFPRAAQANAEMLLIGHIGRKPAYRPWPSLVRCSGTTGSGRMCFLEDIVRQAIMSGHDVIALTQDYDKLAYVMVDSCVASDRCEKTTFADLSDFQMNHLPSLLGSSSLLNVMWSPDGADWEERYTTFLTQLTYRIKSKPHDGRRMVVLLEGFVLLHKDREVFKNVVSACARRDVTLVLADACTHSDTTALLLHADLICFGSSCDEHAPHPYLADLCNKAGYSVADTAHFIEGTAIVAYKGFEHPSILDRMVLSYCPPPRCSAEDLAGKIILAK